jgi:hypothetical protein
VRRVPISPAVSGKPHIPRPQFAHFDHLRDGAGRDGAVVSNVDVYVGTRGRGVFRIRVGYVPTGSAGGRPEPGGAPPRPKSTRPEDLERPGKPEPGDDPTGTKKYPPKPEPPAKPDPSDDPAGGKKSKPKPEPPGKPDPADDPSGGKTYPPKPEA